MERYLLDSNVLIQSEHTIPFDVFPSYWKQLGILFESGEAILHEAVLAELKRVDDDLVPWFKNLDSVKPLKASQDVVDKYIEMCLWANNQSFDDVAVKAFTANTRADAWLCAEAFVLGLVLVTYERSSHSTHKIKIPNVCDAFGVSCISGYDFMRAQGFKF
ncbi:MAG: DUF4411 family protein [Eggerthellaceae bacterium]|nr:DUF4411 family protein [Eggerthellaceae bacterium]MCH4220675.1 DUF4411 family protein [Eggerthellaceae bacterium]